MKELSLLLLIPVVFIIYARNSKGGGTLGKKVRNSDHWAWRDAIYYKKKEIEKLKKELAELESLAYKYPHE